MAEGLCGAPGRIRTSYPLVRSQVLYPDELRALIAALQRGDIITTNLASSKLFGGEGGIRTHGRLAPTPDFESGTFDHSATSPLEGRHYSGFFREVNSFLRGVK